MQERLCRMAELARRRDRLLESEWLDLKELQRLVEDYEAADMICAEEDLRRRLEWYQAKNGNSKLE